MENSPTYHARARLSLPAGWQGIGLIAATYIYFLIFAQFGFLARLNELGIRGEALKPVLGWMAVGGILASLLAPRLRIFNCPRCRLQGGQLGCVAAAFLARIGLNFAAACAVSLLIGLSLGLLTVTLVSHLPRWIGRRHALLKIGLGTGLGYFICNMPVLFTAAPSGIALASAMIMLFAVSLAFANIEDPEATQGPRSSLGFGWVLLFFTVLIWFDSAAFYIIQNNEGLKAGTWSGSVHLYMNAGIHLIVALNAALLLMRRRITVTLGFALVLLASACLFLVTPETIRISALLYPAGVSLYSVALVAYPSFLSQANNLDERARQAGWLYAIAGWIGSAMGIGMAQNLHAVPWQFVAGAAGIASLPLMKQTSRSARTQFVSIAAALIVAGVIYSATTKAGNPVSVLSAAERGHQVYINEGCINCHSQYLRPNTYDNEYWGPASDLAEIRSERPPLIGNRRQGPDLTNIGLRRSPQWLRIHFIEPRAVSYNSPMPSYAYLFNDQRGADLIAYLESVRSPGAEEDRKAMRASWIPGPGSSLQGDSSEAGRELFSHLCATCHDAGGRARWYSGFNRLPPDLSASPLLHIDLNAPEPQLRLQAARIIKFGIPGTDMPGHEYLRDDEVQSLEDFVFAGKLHSRIGQVLH